TGHTLAIVDDENASAARQIIVGETSCELSEELDEVLEGVEFSMLAKDGSVALEANYFAIAAAAYYFVDTYVKGEDVEIEDGTVVREPITKEAKNFILLIGDGMGVNQTLLFNYLPDTTDYSDGEKAFYGYMLPYQGFSRTNSFSGITDSAAGGTALSTGYKTLNGYVGLDKDGREIKSLTELAAELGKATAVMSTESDTGATPASFSAHADSRNNNKEILDDQTALTERLGTIIECRGYTQYAARYLKSNENRIVQTLDTLNQDNDGFFVMYEEAHIDKHSHNNDMESTFLALLSFNQAIARFMEFAFYNPETMVIITADHETGMLLENGDGTLSYNSEDHSSADVPVFAWGEGTAHFDGQTLENIEIAHFFAAQMGVNDFGDQTGTWYDEIYGEAE
ncbi:MAG: alkaline phosphatase, partial [Clostridia bacterium]|nr:alkaline phosphatase [Clostridia bacterium]